MAQPTIRLNGIDLRPLFREQAKEQGGPRYVELGPSIVATFQVMDAASSDREAIAVSLRDALCATYARPERPVPASLIADHARFASFVSLHAFIGGQAPIDPVALVEQLRAVCVSTGARVRMIRGIELVVDELTDGHPDRFGHDRVLADPTEAAAHIDILRSIWAQHLPGELIGEPAHSGLTSADLLIDLFLERDALDLRLLHTFISLGLPMNYFRAVDSRRYLRAYTPKQASDTIARLEDEGWFADVETRGGAVIAHPGPLARRVASADLLAL